MPLYPATARANPVL